MALPHTFADGPGNVASGVEVTANDQYLDARIDAAEYAFSTWQALPRGFGGGAYNSGAAVANYVLGPGGGLGQVATANAPASWALYLNPADVLAGSRTTQMRVRWQCVTNAVAPAANLTCGLYPITGFGGASGNAPTIGSIGTVVTGSSVTFTTPALSTNTVTDSSTFTFPTAGSYALVTTNSATLTAGASVVIIGYIQYRQV